MEKLIELLNEYEIEKNLKSEIFGEKSEFIIISKKFGFIQWLVDEKYKIDTTSLQDYWDRWEMGVMVFNNLHKSDLVILTLSIQDNPIEFLVSILK